ncbi:hypothetical protein PRUPE_5G057300 [Prunus persica]|uniref:Uncharacterized protein n=1 Tax=Prunus persica TaxID=3760 RepID=A0A251P5R4_PRUPE|nr:hypothetical protein PRUPE_5G057300 [Prunus persica]
MGNPDKDMASKVSATATTQDVCSFLVKFGCCSFHYKEVFRFFLIMYM